MTIKKTATLSSNYSTTPDIQLDAEMVYDLVLSNVKRAEEFYCKVYDKAIEVCQQKQADGWEDVSLHINIKYSSDNNRFYLTAEISFDQGRKHLWVWSNGVVGIVEDRQGHNTVIAYSTDINNTDTTKAVADQWYAFEAVVNQLRAKEKEDMENKNRIARIQYLERRVEELEQIIDTMEEKEAEDNDEE